MLRQDVVNIQLHLIFGVRMMQIYVTDPVLSVYIVHILCMDTGPAIAPFCGPMQVQFNSSPKTIHAGTIVHYWTIHMHASKYTYIHIR